MCDKKEDTHPFFKFQLHAVIGNSYFHLQQYPQAENSFSQALQIRKYLVKVKSTSKVSESNDITCDVDIKYRIHICYVKMRQNKKALDILQTVPMRLRDVKINMALGNLFRDTGYDRQSIICYKEALKENSMALEAAENLLKLGVKVTEERMLRCLNI